MVYDPFDHYFNKAKDKGYKARSAFKLKELDEKYNFFNKNTHKILDIGCAPGSWCQYAYKRLSDQDVDYKIVGFDIKDTTLNLKNVNTYNQDITKQSKVKNILQDNNINKLDVIMSDMAPNTTGNKSLDALKSANLIKSTFYLYENFLPKNKKFVIKIFMGPKFQEVLNFFKDTYGGSNIKTYKPKACRSESKETYIIKYQ